MIPFNNTQKILEIGGGEKPQFHPNLDIRNIPGVDIVTDLNKPFPIQNLEFDGIYSSYIIEHISWRNIKHFISEIYRILKTNGTAFIITANLKEQAKVIANKDDIEENDICMLFGDQNYDNNNWMNNAHYCGFTPESAIKLFREAGFNSVTIIPHPNCKTDMIIEARKDEEKTQAEQWNKKQRQEAYNLDYFNGAKGKFGGYAYEGYWDFPIHWNTVDKILSLNPQSVLEIGSARGYVLKKLEDTGIPVAGLEVSKHCFYTRVCDKIQLWDATETPWPITDKSFDLCISMAVLEHIPENKLNAIIQEMERTCKRGLHGVSFTDDNFDKTHTTLHTQEWWSKKFPPQFQIVDKEDLEKGPPNPPTLNDGLIKLNIGSFITMFHHNWINIDIHDLHKWAEAHQYKFQQHDARQHFNLPNESVDMIYSSHFLEHLNYTDGENFLKECYRMMKPQATMRIIVPDTQILINMYNHKSLTELDEINKECSEIPYQAGKFWTLLTSGHAAAYDCDTLHGILKKIGFKTILLQGFRESISNKMKIETLDLLPTISLYIDVIKN